MKSFICAVLIFVLILAGAAAYTQVLNVTTDELINHLFVVEYYIAADDWSACGKAFDILKNEWAVTEKWLKAIVSHREIDQIQIALCELEGCIRVKNKDDATVKVVVLRQLFRLIPANESLSFVNIL